MATAALVSVLAVGLVGCGAAAPGGEPVRSPSAPTGAPTGTAVDPKPEPTRDASSGTVADVPVRSAALDAAATVPTAVTPVALTIPELDITLPVDPVGVAGDGQMEIPPLAERGGWYRFGASPADAAGTAVIAAHVDSVASAGLGPFARLPDAEVGDVVDVTLADGGVRRYAVTAVTRQAKPEVAWGDVFARDGAHRLVLVTCGGTFQRDVGHYTDNVIVTAEPVGA
ncbi:class F sortase [Cellulomonas sp. ATA003]|uniref:class F sortase n=1 Tax=Cellulomonas sp. ATA003 TaxID=3073064 RepID=UPI002873BA1D|nr:class F sortase [Cellulomonas sp. ATA003]WNB85833.1 class F sortase [Cellulomonas sp. ATA003]